MYFNGCSLMLQSKYPLTLTLSLKFYFLCIFLFNLSAEGCVLKHYLCICNESNKLQILLVPIVIFHFINKNNSAKINITLKYDNI